MSRPPGHTPQPRRGTRSRWSHHRHRSSRSAPVLVDCRSGPSAWESWCSTCWCWGHTPSTCWTNCRRRSHRWRRPFLPRPPPPNPSRLQGDSACSPKYPSPGSRLPPCPSRSRIRTRRRSRRSCPQGQPPMHPTAPLASEPSRSTCSWRDHMPPWSHSSSPRLPHRICRRSPQLPRRQETSFPTASAS